MTPAIKVCFAFDSGQQRVRIWGRCDRIELIGGLAPNIVPFTVPVHEYQQLSGNYVRQGDIELYRNDEDAPDVTLGGWAIDHVEDSLRGYPLSEVEKPEVDRTPAVLEKILYLVDRRWEFLDGRGGHAFFGLVNAVQEDGSLKKNTDQITGPDDGITMFAAISAMVNRMQYATGRVGYNSDDIPAAFNDELQVPKPRDLKWDGVHCPSELVRLLDEAEAVWSVQADGTYAIHLIGSGEPPNLPGTELPADMNTVRTRAPTTVLITSAPLRAIDQIDVTGIANYREETWRYVAQDLDGKYKSLEALSYVQASGLTPKALFREQFASIGEDKAALALAVRDFYKVVELSTSTTARRRELLPIIRETCTVVEDANTVKRALPVRVSGKVAMYDGAARRWTNSDELVELGGFTIDPVHGRIHFEQPLGRVESEGAVILRVFEPLVNDQFQVRFAYERHKGDRTDYWMRAYRRDASGNVVSSDIDAALSPTAGDVKTIGIPNLVELRVNGQTVNGQDGGPLEKVAKAIASRVLAENAGTATRRYRGFHSVSPNGVITAVRWIIAEGVTEADLLAYHISKCAYRDRQALLGIRNDVRQASAVTSQAPRSTSQGRRDFAQPPMTWPGSIRGEQPASMRWGQVVDGRTLDPAQEAYHGSVGAFDGYWFIEVDPETLAAIPVGAGASPLWAQPYCDGREDFYPLRVGAYFPFVVLNPGSASPVYRCMRPTDQPFMVIVEKDAGARGSDSTNCSWTYTVKSLDGVTLATGKTPLVPRDDETEYFYGGESGRTTRGLAECSSTTLTLIVVYGEQADSTDCPET